MNENITFSQEQIEISKLSVEEIKALRKIAKKYIKEQNAQENLKSACTELINELVELSETDKYVDKKMITSIVNHFSDSSSSSLPYVFPCINDNLYTLDKIKKIDVINVTETDLLGLVKVYKIMLNV